MTTRREGKYDEIIKKLSLVYGGAIEAGYNIMRTHMKIGKIPDPGYYPEAALKVLRSHAECMEHAARFIDLMRRVRSLVYEERLMEKLCLWCYLAEMVGK